MRILVFGDTHFPFVNKDFFIDLKHVIKDIKPNIIVINGDLVDIHTISHHTPEADSKSTLDEYKVSKDMVAKLSNIIHNLPVRYTLGNHDLRIEKVCNDVSVPRVFLKNFRELYDIPKIWDIAYNHIVDDVMFVHGQSNIRHKATLRYGMSTIQSHFHSMLEISYIKSKTQQLYSAYTGGCCDDSSVGLRYAKNSLDRSIYGMVTIINKIPQVIPL
jgi:Icc-related predicted phosphoesterase